MTESNFIPRIFIRIHITTHVRWSFRWPWMRIEHDYTIDPPVHRGIVVGVSFE